MTEEIDFYQHTENLSCTFAELLKEIKTKTKAGKTVDLRRKVRCDSNIVCKENKRKYHHVNNRAGSAQKISKIRIDGCLIDSNSTEKCDFLLINWDDRTSFFIELKGCDVFKAISQITKSLDHLWKDLQPMGIKSAHARIVYTHNHAPDFRTDGRYLKFMEKCRELGKGTVRDRSVQMKETVSACNPFASRIE